MKNDKLLVPNMFSVLIFKHIFSNLPLDYINSSALLLLMKHPVIGQHLKTPDFSAFHWSPRGSLVSIGQHFVATRVVHLPKSTETSLTRTVRESDYSPTALL